MNCQRCKVNGVSWTSDVMELYGGVQAHLCVGCLNEWHAHLLSHPLWERAKELDARQARYTALALAQRPPGEADYLDLARALNAVKAEAFALGLEFVKPLDLAAIPEPNERYPD